MQKTGTFPHRMENLSVSRSRVGRFCPDTVGRGFIVTTEGRVQPSHIKVEVIRCWSKLYLLCRSGNKLSLNFFGRGQSASSEVTYINVSDRS
jgi:hypothetical protein